MDEDRLWELERGLWLGGPDGFREAMAGDCVMVFPDPVGVLRGEAILAGLAGAPRWMELEITEAALARPTPDVAVLAYRAAAARGEGAAYRALCSSVWVGADAWRIALHQQTPLG